MIAFSCKKIVRDHISVCICTYGRDAMLKRLVQKLALQETDDLFYTSVVIIDNNADGRVRDMVMRLKDDLAMDISYEIGSENIIPTARNHAIRLAKGNYIAIIDDDEFPPPNWLVTMYRTINTFDVDGVLGPVHPYFDNAPPVWLIKGKFCERPTYRTGTLLQWHQTRTGNCLLKKEIFDKHNIYFDLKWKTGGSDRAFFGKAIQAGLKFVACEEAPVYENVPPERCTKHYYIKRALVNGYNAYRFQTSNRTISPKITAPIISVGAVISYALAMPILVFIGTHMVVKFAEKGAHHISQLFAMIGIELVKKRNF